MRWKFLSSKILSTENHIFCFVEGSTSTAARELKKKLITTIQFGVTDFSLISFFADNESDTIRSNSSTDTAFVIPIQCQIFTRQSHSVFAAGPNIIGAVVPRFAPICPTAR